MNKFYTAERNVQIVLSLLKAHGIKRVVASPGATNVSVVASMQHDPFFEIYSCVDERSAAYMACGIADQTSEPVVLSCTGATSSRNYLPGLTEAYYRKLPILALTSTMETCRVGHLYAQATNRTQAPIDTVQESFLIQTVKDEEDAWDCNIKVNKAILLLKHRGGGPVHLNVTTQGNKDFSIKDLPRERLIERFTSGEHLPVLPNGKIAIFIGSHKPITSVLERAIDLFCAKYNAVVYCDHTSNYYGKYKYLYALEAAQEVTKEWSEIDVLVHIGDVSGEYYTLAKLKPKEVWRLSEDGEIRDRFKTLRYVFEMDELCFFMHYAEGNFTKRNSNVNQCWDNYNTLLSKFPELPFSNIWIAHELSYRLPPQSHIYFGILNSLRSWNFFKLPKSVISNANVGGFGIDGMLSTLVGASLIKKDTLFLGVVGDLGFFYDINVLGNRHLSNNVRILLINNGHGQEFRNYGHDANIFGEETDKYIAAAGHNGNKSQVLVRNIAINLGFEYLSAIDKVTFLQVCERFVSDDVSSKPIIFEVFTNQEDESDALRLTRNIEKNVLLSFKSNVKNIGKRLMGETTIDFLKKMKK